jgi:hypothetical protein
MMEYKPTSPDNGSSVIELRNKSGGRVLNEAIGTRQGAYRIGNPVKLASFWTDRSEETY